ncbi:aspartate aminotransferase family protein [Streptomyces sp. NK08204]|uniref:aspartate aminotransferase family protein n=1 Tax=Streptomyces sp. NK08204 TaxID=2873260 RepID=UPI001CED0495|nr:aminotransferase class III-fold pyridoxal phosphate-dependent enzyme [Streptomyces sp. NK08204]
MTTDPTHTTVTRDSSGLGALTADSALSGDGLWLHTPDGRSLLDAASGTFNLPLGYAHPHVVTAVQEQAGRVSHASSHFTRPAGAALATRLLAHAPEQLSRGWIRDVSGSTANECAVKIAQKYTGRRQVVSFFLSHHGQTMATTAMSGNAFRRRHFPATATTETLVVPGAYCHRCFYNSSYPSCQALCATRIEDFLEYASSGDVAAVLVEPVLGNGGNIVPPPEFFRELRRICDRHGIVLIADEVQTALGRTGHMFASQRLGLEPDVITLAKGLGGIGLPIGAVLMREELDVLDAHEHSFTSGASLLGLAAAHATLDVLEQPGFLERVDALGETLGARLRDLADEVPAVSDVRGLGYMWGIELSRPDGSPDPELARETIAAAESGHDLVVRGSRYGLGNVVKVRPALVAEERDLDDICARLRLALLDATKTLESDRR